MSHVEVVQLDANFQNWKKSSGAGLRAVEPFLFYAVDNILKTYNLPIEDVKYGITDHSNDGGIDAFYILANRNTVVRDDLDLASSGTDRLRLIIFQSKSSTSETGFKADDIDKFTKFVDDLLNLEKDPSQFHHKYEGHLRAIMQTYKAKYLSIAGYFPKVQLDFYYITRGDETAIRQIEQDAIDRLEKTVKEHLGDSAFTFYPVNTQALLTYVKKRRQKIKLLKWSDAVPLPIGEGYIGLVKLFDWYKFLKDSDTGELDELIFESNVRGFRGNSTINRHIRDTLRASSVNFWQLNNGVTIVSGNKLQPVDSMNLNIEDPQVVNGLQTSRVIFEYFHPSGKHYSANSISDMRSLLVRVLKVGDEQTQNDVIKATNSQNPMQPSALRGTDNIHRQIEDLYGKYGYYYDRRPGFYRDKGVAIESIIGYTELIQAVVALLLHRPDDARARPGNYIALTKKGDAKYATIFAMDAKGNAKQPLGFYLKSVQIVRFVDEFLEKKGVPPGDHNNLKFYLAYYVCAVVTQKYHPNADSILQIDSSAVEHVLEKVAYPAVLHTYQSLIGSAAQDAVARDAAAKGTQLLEDLDKELAATYPNDEAILPTKAKKKVRDVISAGAIK